MGRVSLGGIYTALPNLESYSATERQSFKRFVNDFSIRYHKAQWNDRSLIQLFQRFLKKRPLVTFETQPREVKEGTFEDVIEVMKERLQEDGDAAKVKPLTQSRNLAMRADQSVEEFCVALERLANRTFPDVPEEVVSLQKAEILFRQLAQWPGSYSLSEALETSEGSLAYENAKRAALRLEINHQTDARRVQ